MFIKILLLLLLFLDLSGHPGKRFLDYVVVKIKGRPGKYISTCDQKKFLY